MSVFDSELSELRQSTLRKEYLESTLNNLYVQRDHIQEALLIYEKHKATEQSDVDRLESGLSPLSLFYSMIGKREEKLDKERTEAYAAAVKYNSASQLAAAIESEIRLRESELPGLAGCDEKYADLLSKKLAFLKENGQENTDAFRAAEEKISYIKHQTKEIEEALEVGGNALETVKKLYNTLSSAEDWGTWDMVGGGLLAGVAKYEDLDQAQIYADKLQRQLHSFQTELADITIHTQFDIGIDDFTRFADFFFDNIFMDWTVQDKINHSQEQVRQTRSEIESSIEHLDVLLTEANRNLEEARQQFEDLILSSS